MRIAIIFSLIFFLVGSSIYAQEIVTDRPDQTESAVTLEKSAFQIESGFLIQNQSWHSSNILLPTNLFRYGLSSGFELRLVHEFSRFEALDVQEKYTGFNDIQIGFKVQIFKSESSNTEVAFLSHLNLPTGTGLFFTEDSYGTINKLSIAHTISDRFNIGYNIGYDYFDFGEFTYSLALGFGLTELVGFYVEPYGSFSDSGDHISNFDAGFTYLLKENFQLDFSFGTGLNIDMNYLSLGLSWLIPGKQNE